MSRTNYSTYIAIKRKLVGMMRAGVFEGNRLPSESLLAQSLGVSLVTLRESLLLLAFEGYITKRHGVGNFIHPSALGFENRSLYFADCLASAGYEVRIERLSQEFVPADKTIAREMRMEEGARVLRYRLCYLANEHPAIYVTGHMNAALLRNDRTETISYNPLHEMLWNFCGTALAHALNEYTPAGAKGEVCEILRLPAGTPVICNVQTFYDTYDVPVLYNVNYFNSDYYRIRTIQNWDVNQPADR